MNQEDVVRLDYIFFDLFTFPIKYARISIRVRIDIGRKE
jgi:hypothetical protein